MLKDTAAQIEELAQELDSYVNSGAKMSPAEHGCMSVGGALHDIARRLLAAHSDGAQEPVAVVDENDDGLFIEILYGDNGSPLKRGDALYTHPQPLSQTDAARDVMAERQRQIEVEGFSPTHDSKQTPGDLARAAACYAMHAAGVHTAETHPPSIWPRNWSVKWWKPDVSRRDLVKAAALILAEIEPKQQ